MCIASAVVAGCAGAEAEPAKLDASVAFVVPTDGATVPSPVVVRADVSGLVLAPAGPVAPGEAHLHLLVDVVCVPAGRTIPIDDRHIHLGGGEDAVTLELEPGTHTLCLQAGDGGHQALPYADRVTIEVTR